MTVLDLFAGPGGWSEACLELGITEVGIEHDASACLTRAAAGHLTISQDVSTIDTARFRGIDGLIASPPCPTFSAAGGRAGIAELRYLIEHVHACVTEWKPYAQPASLGTDDEGRNIPTDPRSALVLEPLRFALECVPEWIALEQVPDVLPVWEAYRFVLQAHGWSVWFGILNAADYGVPQTRRRAILMAHRRYEVTAPEPTHCEGGASTLLGELAPWVSMAEALGWGCTERPIVTVAAGHTRGTVGGGSGGRAAIERERERGAWVVDTRGDSGQEQDTFNAENPSRTLTGKSDSWMLRHNQAERHRPKDAEGKARTRNPETGEDYYLRFPADAPAPILTTQAAAWVWERPATTVQGDPRLAPPGHRDREGGEPQFGSDALKLTVSDALKLTVSDALKLQSFRADYPVQGTKTKKFEQIGNAVPPRLARAVLASLTQGDPS
jgi:DNA (cytosine-5)-methyltransferase 1